ncbi:phage tail tape measure protein [Kordia sp. TARA_039_SRF]|nr:phage tail tape measure protein [Kordia sp. TARA_039_SRF]
MASVLTEWILRLKDDVSKPLQDVNGKAKQSAIDMLAVAESAKKIQDSFNQALQPGIQFQSSLADVEAITGVTGKALDSLGLKARKSAIDFGGNASGAMENYKVLLSKLSPDLANNQGALDSMNRSAFTLSKTMGNDVSAAMKAATTSMLQYQVPLKDADAAAKEMDRMINVMAGGAKYGSAEVNSVAKAIEVSGVAASQSKVSFEEVNAAIQELSRGGKEGAEAGVALRNVLGKMAGKDVIPKAALAKLESYGVNMDIVGDKTIPFTARLRELSKAQGDATVFAQVFGVENAAAANILVRSVDAQDALREKITGTNTAYEQAAVKMNTYAEWKSRVAAKITDYKIRLFNLTKGFIPFINFGLSTVQMLAHLKNAKQGLSMATGILRGGITKLKLGLKSAGSTALGFARNLLVASGNALRSAGSFMYSALVGIGSYVSALITATAAQLGLNIAMSSNPLGLLVLGIGAVVGGIALMVKYWDKIKAAILSFGQWILKNNPFTFLINLLDYILPGFAAGVNKVFGFIKDLILGFWEAIKAVWNGIKSFFGFGDEEKEPEVTIKVSKTSATDGTPEEDPFKIEDAAPTDPTINPESTTTSTHNSTTTGTGTGGSGKILNVTMNINNNFGLKGNGVINNIEEIADQLIGKINDGLRDSLIAIE